MKKTEQGSVVAWIALMVAIAALCVAWLAYNRTGEERLEDIVREQASENYQRLERLILGKEKATSTATSTDEVVEVDGSE